MVQVDEGGDGQRIDNFLLKVLKGVPRTRIYRLLRTGEVRVNKGRAKPSQRLNIGDQVRIPPIRTASTDAQVPAAPRQVTERLAEQVIYEDSGLLVLNKPSGMAVHGGSGLAFGVIEALRAARPTERQLELAHRLDRDTSGCLMIAKRRSALRRLQELQRAQGIEKRYLALVGHAGSQRRYRVDLPLRKNVLRSGEREVRVAEDGKPSSTLFEVQRRAPWCQLVEARLQTGRTHQIRVHSLAAGHPLLGDPKYGDPALNRAAEDCGLHRLFLHAAVLRLPWPEAGERLEIRAPLPAELDAVLKRIPWNQ